ncbi:hypothetical protein PybrP1_000470 [[Pythium] brassicae (nom. inval.)]|nr:hypothetical protein PybrP1_000470 [[Pythium] brassicae (nom. inval.)]
MTPARRSLVRKRSPPATLPPSLLLLEQVTLKLSAAKAGGRRGDDPAYTLALSHRATGTAWTQPPRAFDEFRQLQQRLLTALRRGHVCSADCAYLYSFVKSCFPKSALFGRSSACLMEKRRAELAHCLARLQQFVLARENHGCGVLVGDGDYPTDDVSPCVCSLCDASLDGEAFGASSSSSSSTRSSSSRSSAAAGSSRGSSQKAPCLGLSYTTTLGCGHQFHDECIVPKLNERMQCPTCGHDEFAARS